MQNKKFIFVKIISFFILYIFLSTICTDTVKGIQNNKLKKIKILLENQNSFKEVAVAYTSQQTSVNNLSIPVISVSGATYDIYGISGNGRDLGVYKIGNGPKIFIMIFEVHGYEDAWPKDGEELVKIGGKVINDLADYASDTGELNGWTVYIIRAANPDGLIDGYTNDGPGRCTVKDRVDMNRSFPVDFLNYTSDRNNTGGAPLASKESFALYNFIYNKNPDVVVDVHGWENKTLGNGEIGKFFDEQFGFEHNNNYQQGSVTDWARTLKGGTTKSTLVELPWPDSSQDIINKEFAQKVSNATLNIIKEGAKILQKMNIDEPSNGQILSNNFDVYGWAVGTLGIKEVKVYVDNQFLDNASIGVFRPDIKNTFPQYINSDKSGFSYTVDLREISEGAHRVTVKAIGNDGTFTEATRNITVSQRPINYLSVLQIGAKEITKIKNIDDRIYVSITQMMEGYRGVVSCKRDGILRISFYSFHSKRQVEVGFLIKDCKMVDGEYYYDFVSFTNEIGYEQYVKTIESMDGKSKIIYVYIGMDTDVAKCYTKTMH